MGAPSEECLLPLSIDGQNFSSLHFAGIMGSGMSAIAQYLAWSGQAVTGSDRIAFADEMKDCKEKAGTVRLPDISPRRQRSHRRYGGPCNFNGHRRR